MTRAEEKVIESYIERYTHYAMDYESKISDLYRSMDDGSADLAHISYYYKEYDETRKKYTDIRHLLNTIYCEMQHAEEKA